MAEAIGEGHSSLGCFDSAELERWATSGASEPGLDHGLRSLLKAQFLCAAIGRSFGPDVEQGLAREELVATLVLAARPSRDWRQHGEKEAALRSHASLHSSSDLVAAMVRAALHHDERRLARAEGCPATAGHRPCRPGSSPVGRTDAKRVSPVRELAFSLRRRGSKAERRHGGDHRCSSCELGLATPFEASPSGGIERELSAALSDWGASSLDRVMSEALLTRSVGEGNEAHRVVSLA